jgi:hypothetical protein
MISVTVKLDAGLGADLDNFTITAQPSATVLASGVSRASLLSGSGVTYTNVDDNDTNLDVTSTGLCTDTIDILITLIVDVPPDTEAPTEPIFDTPPTKDPDGTKVTYTWSASTDNVAVTGYELSRYGVIQATLGAGTLTYEFTGLTQNTEYQFSVLAFDAAGNKSIENFDTETTAVVPVTVYANTLQPTNSGNPICATSGSFTKYCDNPVPETVGAQWYDDAIGTIKWTGAPDSGGGGNWYGVNNNAARLRLADGYCSAVAACY